MRTRHINRKVVLKKMAGKPIEVYSFFSGAGFLDLGFEEAGFDIVFVKVQFTRDYTGEVSDGGSARQIFHVMFKLSLVAAVVVIIKSTTRRLSSKDTFSQVSR